MTLAEVLENVSTFRQARRPHWNAGDGLAVDNGTGFLFVIDKRCLSLHACDANIWKPRYEDIVAKDWEFLDRNVFLPQGLFSP